ncbi:MAG TPA: type VI secretion system baseplate subunit TssF [Caulobacteraceae bacterium]|nr:type VI secretion system baseplate subunit TssF [Caulobacteraceae bacterium]
MADDLLAYYNRELLYLRKLGAQFADQHPKIAGRLRMAGEAVEDPHVLRLLEGVAFLNARIRAKLEDEFPELAEGLLDQLYPHYLAPIPSMAIVQFTGAADLAKKVVAPAETELITEPVAGEACRFRTTTPVDVWPIEIDSAAFAGRPLPGPLPPPGSTGVFRITLKCLSKDMTFQQLAPDSLRFFLRGQTAEVMQLYELILNNTVGVVLADSPSDPRAVPLGPGAVKPVGFEADEGMLPYSARSPLGYRLLTEYFTFPEKFLFFDVAGLGAKLAASGGRSLDLYIYVNRSSVELERSTSAASFALGCAPVVNLFRQRAEPMTLNGATAEYLVTPDSRRPGALEVYSVDRVTATSPAGEAVTFAPLFGLTHAGVSRRETRFWHASRRPYGGGGDPQPETWLTFVDLDGEPTAPNDWVASIETTCTNRDLPAKLPFGGGHPHLRLAQSRNGIKQVACLTAPTPTVRHVSRKEAAWRLVSHLNLNHLSLADQAGGAEALREILRLYDFRDAPETRAMIDAVQSIQARRATARAPDRAMGVLCRGLDVTITFDEQLTSGGGVFLLASVLERFIAHYASINAFTRLTAVLKGRPGALRTWSPRAGDLALL